MSKHIRLRVCKAAVQRTMRLEKIICKHVFRRSKYIERKGLNFRSGIISMRLVLIVAYSEATN